MNLMKSLAVSEFAAEGVVDELEELDEPEAELAICDAREFMALMFQPFGRGSRGNIKI
jgi:hypothetical protein